MNIQSEGKHPYQACNAAPPLGGGIVNHILRTTIISLLFNMVLEKKGVFLQNNYGSPSF
jgi:hypothetical protein